MAKKKLLTHEYNMIVVCEFVPFPFILNNNKYISNFPI